MGNIKNSPAPTYVDHLRSAMTYLKLWLFPTCVV